MINEVMLAGTCVRWHCHWMTTVRKELVHLTLRTVRVVDLALLMQMEPVEALDDRPY